MARAAAVHAAAPGAPVSAVRPSAPCTIYSGQPRPGADGPRGPGWAQRVDVAGQWDVPALGRPREDGAASAPRSRVSLRRVRERSLIAKRRRWEGGLGWPWVRESRWAAVGVSDIVPSSSGPQGPDEDGNEGNVHWEKGAAEHGERGAAERLGGEQPLDIRVR